MNSPQFPRNEPCPCGSGIVYKFCHQAVLEAPPDKVLQAGHEQYARAWATNAGHYEKRGYYADLAREVLDRAPRRVLDVGCGLGQGLSAIAGGLGHDGRFIVGLDENPLCLDATATALAKIGIDAEVVKRLVGVPVPGQRHYDLRYESGRLAVRSDTTLIQSDVMVDAELDEFLATLPPFDAVTFWFTGIHKARQGLRRLDGLDMDSGHRELLQTRVFELAAKYLRPNGFMHIAERGGAADFGTYVLQRGDQLRLLAGAAFDVLPPAVRPYTEPTNSNRIGVGSKQFDIRKLRAGIVSATAIKRV